jgi:hypothetical protein
MVTGQTVRFTRAGLVEEYSVSMDGVRQDFVVPQKPAGDGQLVCITPGRSMVSLCVEKAWGNP